MPAIIVIVVIAAAVLGWWLLQRQPDAAGPAAAVEDDFSDVKPPTSLEFEGSTAIATFDIHIDDDGPGDALRDLLVKYGRQALQGKGVDVDRISVRAWRGGHVTEVATARMGVSVAADDSGPMPEAADFDPLGDLHHADFGSGALVERTIGELAPIGQALTLTDKITSMLQSKGVDATSMTITQLIIALFESTGYAVSLGSVPGTYDASRGVVRTFLTIVDHKKGAYPELAEEAVDSFVIRFMSSGADRGLLFTDKYGPFSVYDKEKRESRIRFITRERLQAFVDSVAMR